ncbi:MAG TPA: hypothetical protein V6D33_12685 [Cyanophyceae cyanobacterium]
MNLDLFKLNLFIEGNLKNPKNLKEAKFWMLDGQSKYRRVLFVNEGQVIPEGCQRLETGDADLNLFVCPEECEPPRDRLYPVAFGRLPEDVFTTEESAKRAIVEVFLDEKETDILPKTEYQESLSYTQMKQSEDLSRSLTKAKTDVFRAKQISIVEKIQSRLLSALEEGNSTTEDLMLLSESLRLNLNTLDMVEDIYSE